MNVGRREVIRLAKLALLEMTNCELNLQWNARSLRRIFKAQGDTDWMTFTNEDCWVIIDEMQTQQQRLRKFFGLKG